MKEIFIINRERFFLENYPFLGVPKLTDKRECIHCGKVITVGNYKIYENEVGFQFICCPNSPECDGTVIDWVAVGLFKSE